MTITKLQKLDDDDGYGKHRRSTAICEKQTHVVTGQYLERHGGSVWRTLKTASSSCEGYVSMVSILVFFFAF